MITLLHIFMLWYAEYEILIDIRTLEIISGNFPKRAFGIGIGMGAGVSRRINGGLAAMQTESDSKKDTAIDMIPPIIPSSPWRVAEVSAYPEFRLKVRFLDGLHGWVEMKELIHSKNAGVFSVLG